MKIPVRFRLRSMLVAVAIVAVVLAWPVAASAAAFLLGPAMFGGWLGGRRMRDRVIEGSLIAMPVR